MKDEISSRIDDLVEQICIIAEIPEYTHSEKFRGVDKAALQRARICNEIEAFLTPPSSEGTIKGN